MVLHAAANLHYENYYSKMLQNIYFLKNLTFNYSSQNKIKVRNTRILAKLIMYFSNKNSRMAPERTRNAKTK